MIVSIDNHVIVTKQSYAGYIFSVDVATLSSGSGSFFQASSFFAAMNLLVSYYSIISYYRFKVPIILVRFLVDLL